MTLRWSDAMWFGQFGFEETAAPLIRYLDSLRGAQCRIYVAHVDAFVSESLLPELIIDAPRLVYGALASWRGVAGSFFVEARSRDASLICDRRPFAIVPTWGMQGRTGYTGCVVFLGCDGDVSADTCSACETMASMVPPEFVAAIPLRGIVATTAVRLAAKIGAGLSYDPTHATLVNAFRNHEAEVNAYLEEYENRQRVKLLSILSR